MGCCYSKEDDRFDGSEALLPKGRNGANKRVEKSVEVDLAKKDGANGSYKSPSAVVAAGDANSKVPAKPQPPKKKPVETVDLLGLNEKPPTPLAAPVVKAPSPAKPAVPVVKPESPPKPAQTSPPKPSQTSPPKKLPKTSPKKPSDTEDNSVMASAFTSVSVKAEDADDDNDNDNDNDDDNDNDNDGDDNDNADNDGEDKPKEPKPAKKTTPTKKSKKKRKKGRK